MPEEQKSENEDKTKMFDKVFSLRFILFLILVSILGFGFILVINQADSKKGSFPYTEEYFDKTTGTFISGPTRFAGSESDLGLIVVKRDSDSRIISVPVPLSFSAKKGDKLQLRYFKYQFTELQNDVILLIEKSQTQAKPEAEEKSMVAEITKNLDQCNHRNDQIIALLDEVSGCMQNCEGTECAKCYFEKVQQRNFSTSTE